jgi:hypothetical protein
MNLADELQGARECLAVAGNAAPPPSGWAILSPYVPESCRRPADRFRGRRAPVRSPHFMRDSSIVAVFLMVSAYWAKRTTSFFVASSGSRFSSAERFSIRRARVR